MLLYCFKRAAMALRICFSSSWASYKRRPDVYSGPHTWVISSDCVHSPVSSSSITLYILLKSSGEMFGSLSTSNGFPGWKFSLPLSSNGPVWKSLGSDPEVGVEVSLSILASSTVTRRFSSNIQGASAADIIGVCTRTAGFQPNEQEGVSRLQEYSMVDWPKEHRRKGKEKSLSFLQLFWYT